MISVRHYKETSILLHLSHLLRSTALKMQHPIQRNMTIKVKAPPTIPMMMYTKFSPKPEEPAAKNKKEKEKKTDIMKLAL